MARIVLLSDPRIAAVTVKDCGEPLVDLRTVAALRVDDRRADPAGAYAHVRAGVVDLLVTAQSLLDRGLRLLVVEGYRPPALQARYFREYLDQLRAVHPAWSAARLRERTSRYVAPPEVAPHVCGAAVDLTLVDVRGTELPMGTDVNTDPAVSHLLADIPAAARANRRILSTALGTAGFVNDPTEWWHWSYGDQYWAFMTGRDAARYGPVPD